MNGRLLAQLLFRLGMFAIPIFLFFGNGWADSGTLERFGFVVLVAVTAVGACLDFRYRLEDRSIGRQRG